MVVVAVAVAVYVTVVDVVATVVVGFDSVTL